MSLGAALRTLRGSRAQDEIADAASVSQSYLSELERDAKHPSLRILTRIAMAAGADAATLARLESLWRTAELAGVEVAA